MAGELQIILSFGHTRDVALGNRSLNELQDDAVALMDESWDHKDAVALYMSWEETRYWFPGELEYVQAMKRATDILNEKRRERGMDALPLIMYEPNHARASRLMRVSNVTRTCIKGAYVGSFHPTNASHKAAQRLYIRWSVEQAKRAVRENGIDGAYGVVLEMYEDPSNRSDDARVAAWARHDSYAALIAGAKIILVWSGAANRTGFRRTYNSYLEAYGRVGQELKGIVGNVFDIGQPIPLTIDITRGSNVTLNGKICSRTEDLLCLPPGNVYRCIAVYFYEKNVYIFAVNCMMMQPQAPFGSRFLELILKAAVLSIYSIILEVMRLVHSDLVLFSWRPPHPCSHVLGIWKCSTFGPTPSSRLAPMRASRWINNATLIEMTTMSVVGKGKYGARRDDRMDSRGMRHALHSCPFRSEEAERKYHNEVPSIRNR